MNIPKPTAPKKAANEAKPEKAPKRREKDSKKPHIPSEHLTHSPFRDSALMQKLRNQARGESK